MARSVTIWRRPYVRPKKNAPNVIQNRIMVIAVGLGLAKSKAPGRNRIANKATTRTGDPRRMASVRGFRASVSKVRRVDTHHWRRWSGRALPPRDGSRGTPADGSGAAAGSVGLANRPGSSSASRS